MSVTTRFIKFLNNITLSPDQRSNGETKQKGVRNCMNQHYYGQNSDTAHSMLVGSWGKSTEVRPPRDVDILFDLPISVYHQYQGRAGNKQSQLLQEVRGVLARKYPNTKIKGDGPAVVIDFETFKVELVPAFSSGSYWQIPITKDTGRYKNFAPYTEINHVQTSDASSNSKTRNLIRMMKTWQRYCNVDIKSFWLELLAVDFLASWSYRTQGMEFYDWMVRDYLAYIKVRTKSTVIVPGTGERLNLGSRDWGSKAETAYDRAVKACGYEAASKTYEAGLEWQKIFGTDIPLTV